MTSRYMRLERCVRIVGGGYRSGWWVELRWGHFFYVWEQVTVRHRRERQLSVGLLEVAVCPPHDRQPQFLVKQATNVDNWRHHECDQGCALGYHDNLVRQSLLHFGSNLGGVEWMGCMTIDAGASPLLQWSTKHDSLSCFVPSVLSGKPQRQLSYIPFIPRLQGYFQSEAKIDALSYRDNHVHILVAFVMSSIVNIIVACLTRKLWLTVMSGAYCYFSNPTDIAFSFCADGTCSSNVEEMAPSATPLIIQIYNLPPTIRTHSLQPHISRSHTSTQCTKRSWFFCISIWWGMCKTGLWCTYIQCCHQIAFSPPRISTFTLGTWSQSTRNWESKATMDSVHAAHVRSRVRNVTGGAETNYYYPWHYLQLTVNHSKLDPTDLPLRTHASFAAAREEIQKAPTKRQPMPPFSDLTCVNSHRTWQFPIVDRPEEFSWKLVAHC